MSMGRASARRADDLAAQTRTVAGWLSESSRELVGAGAGLSVAAGIDYTNTEDFAFSFRRSCGAV